MLKNYCKVSIDTRTLMPGDLFVALKGPNFDGHEFVKAAAAKGAIAAMVEHEITADLPQIRVPDTFKALGEFAKKRRQQVSIPIIGLTGSCGKTTTKTMLASILVLAGPTLATEKNLNNNIGVPLTLLRLTPEHKYAVIEIGANQPQEIDYAAELVKPDIAIITNAAPVHLEGFGTLDDVARIKGDILRWLTNDGVAILNADDKYFDYWQNLLNGKRVISFAIQRQADVTAHDIDTSFTLQLPTGETKITLKVFGEHNIMNALAAAAAAHVLDIDMVTIKQGLETMAPVAGRLLKKIGKNGSIILDDSYNANPRSMQAALKVLIQHPGEKILIAGDMAELGADTERFHHELGIMAREFGVQRLYAVGELTQLTVTAFGEGGYYFTNRDELIAAVNNVLQPSMTILVKGSKVNRMWEMVTALLKTEAR